jgi:hypothetical protein
VQDNRATPVEPPTLRGLEAALVGGLVKQIGGRLLVRPHRQAPRGCLILSVFVLLLFAMYRWHADLTHAHRGSGDHAGEPLLMFK